MSRKQPAAKQIGQSLTLERSLGIDETIWQGAERGEPAFVIAYALLMVRDELYSLEGRVGSIATALGERE